MSISARVFRPSQVGPNNMPKGAIAKIKLLKTTVASLQVSCRYSRASHSFEVLEE